MVSGLVDMLGLFIQVDFGVCCPGGYIDDMILLLQVVGLLIMRRGG